LLIRSINSRKRFYHNLYLTIAEKLIFITTYIIIVYSETCVKQPHKEAQKVAAEGRWLLNRGYYQYKFNIWEYFVWLLKTGCCLIEVTANTGLTVCP